LIDGSGKNINQSAKKSSATDKNNKYSSMEEQLRDWGVSKQHYLRSVGRKAKEHGYPPFQLATDGKHKLEIRTPQGRLVRFGRLGYGDYILYTSLEAQGKSPKGFAEQKRSGFQNSHTKIKGNWKSNDYSPNNLALRILW
jgi:hypothetical protein